MPRPVRGEAARKMKEALVAKFNESRNKATISSHEIAANYVSGRLSDDELCAIYENAIKVLEDANPPSGGGKPSDDDGEAGPPQRVRRARPEPMRDD